MRTKTWFITGCSSGLGRALCEEVLGDAQHLVATARNPDDVADLAGDRCLVAPLDVTVPAQIDAAVAAAHERFGAIDVLVNNTGYQPVAKVIPRGTALLTPRASLPDLDESTDSPAIRRLALVAISTAPHESTFTTDRYGEVGPIEQIDDVRARRQFDVNVFGVLAVQRAVLPGMRARRAGHALSISSIAGFVAPALAGMYCASKHALEAITEALAAEVADFGIRVTAIEPGRFRTDFSGRSRGTTDDVSDDYRDVVADLAERRRELDGRRQGDPRKAARAMLDVVASADPPRRLLLGTDAWEMAQERLGHLRDEFAAHRDVTLSTDFADEDR